MGNKTGITIDKVSTLRGHLIAYCKKKKQKKNKSTDRCVMV